MYRAEPKVVDPSKMVGYTLEQAEPTQTRPPYVLSQDPEDPIFYSTCYVYKSGVQWLPTIKQSVDGDWAFSTQCLECSAYRANEANNATTPKDGKTPKWIVSSTCTDCNNPTLCWKDCPYKLPDGSIYDDQKTKKPRVPAPKKKPSFRKRVKHSFHMVGTTKKEVSENIPRIAKAIAVAFSVDPSQVKILEVISISGVDDDRRRRGLLSSFMKRNLNKRRGRYLVAFRVKVVYEISVVDDTEAERVEKKMTDQKTNLELATNIEKETGLTTAVEASGEAPLIETTQDKNDDTSGNNKPGNNGVIVVVAIGSACVCLALAFGFYYKRKVNTKMNSNKKFQEFQNAVETKSVVEGGLHTAAVPIQIQHGSVNEINESKRVIEMQHRAKGCEAPALPSRSHFTRPAAVSGSAHSTPAVANMISTTDSSNTSHPPATSYYSTIDPKRTIPTKKKKSAQKPKNVRSTSNSGKNSRHLSNPNVPAQYRNHIRHGVLDTHFSVDDLPENYISTPFGDGELLYERPFDNAKVVKLKWGVLYQINAYNK